MNSIRRGSLGAYANDVVFSTSNQTLAIRAKAEGADVKIAVLCGAMGEVANLLTSHYVEYLSRSVTASCEVIAVWAKADTANNTIVIKIVDKIDIKSTHDVRVEDCVPILAGAMPSW